MRVVAGVGFRRGASAEAIAALVRRALAEAGRADLAALATASDRAEEAAFRAAAGLLAVEAFAPALDALVSAAPAVLTRSPRALARYGVGSLAEAAALAAAGEGARLVFPRIAGADVTCALAETAA